MVREVENSCSSNPSCFNWLTTSQQFTCLGQIAAPALLRLHLWVKGPLEANGHLDRGGPVVAPGAPKNEHGGAGLTRVLCGGDSG